MDATTLYGDLEKDFRAEVTAAEMIELGLPPDRVVVMVTGAAKRPVRKDVQSIEEESAAYDHGEYVVVKTPREGFYDMLPEGLFHHPTAHKSAATAKEISKAIKRRKAEEEEARRFFLPFEATINHVRTQLSYYENQLDKRTQYDKLVNLFTDQWEIFEHLDARQANLFLHLIPVLHEVRDDHPVVETILALLLRLPVTVRLRSQQPYRPAAPIVSLMGDSLLGVDLTTGNEVYDEGCDEIVVKIGPVSGEVFQQFMPGGSNEKLVERLLDHLLPAHIDVVTEVELENAGRCIRFVDETSTLNSVLGTDTFL